MAKATTLSPYRSEELSNSPPHVISLSPAWSIPPKTARVGNSDLAYARHLRHLEDRHPIVIPSHLDHITRVAAPRAGRTRPAPGSR